MSYCRFSRESDVYAYPTGNGHAAVHVANHTYSDEDKLNELLSAERLDFDAVQKLMVPLDSVHAGMQYHVDTLEELRAKLLELRASGLRVPDHAIERVEREIMEGQPWRENPYSS